MKKYLLFSIIVFFALWVFSPSYASAANHYIRAGATGANNGSDWTNAYTSLPATLNRGDTYYIADGTYSGYTFDDAAPDTTLITIKKAIESDHGTSTGWLSSYGNGTATFTGPLYFNTSYWVFDGQQRNADWKSGYGFKVAWASRLGNASMIMMGINYETSVSYITIRYTEVQGSADGTGLIWDRGISTATYNSNITISRCYVHDTGETIIMTITNNLLTVEYSWLARNGAGPGVHSGGLVLRDGTSNVIFRYNVMEDMGSTAYIETPTVGHPGCAGPDTANWYIYGNVFSAGAGTRWNYDVLTVFDHHIVGDFYFVNNTIVGVPYGRVGMSTGGGGDGCADNLVARNNLYVSVGSGGISSANVTSPVITHNAFFSSPNSISGTDTQTGSGSPLINWQGGDFHLSYATNAGVTLTGIYTTDPGGVTRGADGVWDRGAYEYTGTTPPPTYCGDSSCNGTETCSSCSADCGVCSDTQAPSVPANLSATAVSSSQINLSWSASTDNVGVAGYRIYRAGTQIGTSLSNSYSNTGLIANTTYSYTVSAYDAAGNVSAQSVSASATTAEGTAVFNIGDRVQVTSDPSLRVRSTPGLSDATILGNQLKGSQGTVIGGPVSLDGYIWWQIDYDVSPDGWSIESWLAKAGLDITPPAAPSGVRVN